MAVDQSTCSVESCDRGVPRISSGLCDAHYKLAWRTGDVKANVPIQAARSASVPVTDFEDGSRECQDCGARKPLGEFHRDKRAPKGHRKTCKTCRVSKEAARYAARPEFYREKYRKDRAENSDRYRAVDLDRYERHRAKRIALATETTHQRRARLAEQESDRGISRNALRRLDGDDCCYCGVAMVFGTFTRGTRPATMATIEHVLPVSSGGSHTWRNCALACWRCNSSRSNRPGNWQLRKGHRLSTSE